MRSHKLPDRLQEALQKRGITRADLSEALKVSRSAVDSWMSGGRKPPVDTVERIAVILNTDAAWLLFGTKVTAAPTPSDTGDRGAS